jgi:hypothetical protein
LKVKEKLYLVHVSEANIPKDVGLKAAPVGIEKTLVVVEPNNSKDKDILNVLDIICSIELFQNTPLRSLRDLIQSSQMEVYKEGDFVRSI